jgi:integrase
VPDGSRQKRVVVPPGCVHRPKPKGGKDRAFTVPLPEHVLGILRQRQAENRMLFTEGDGGWVFPTFNRAGEVVCVREAKEQEYWKDDKGKLRKRTRLPTPHRLRDTFLTACREAGVGQLETTRCRSAAATLRRGICSCRPTTYANARRRSRRSC